MKLLTIILAISLSLSAIAERAILTGPEKVGKSDSGINGPSYEQIVENLSNLVERNGDMSDLVEIGKSETGISTKGILIYDKKIKTKILVMMSGATHGNEYLNIVDRLPLAFLDPSNIEFQNFFKRGGAVFILPIFNPYGYTSDRRENSNRKDLNRDFSNVIKGIKRFTQKETRNIKNWVANYLKRSKATFRASVDYHCCYKGSLLFPWAFDKDRPLPPGVRAKYDAVGELLKKQLPHIRYGATGEIIWYSADGTSKDYWFAKYGALAFTYEGHYRKEAQYLTQHINWWKDIVKGL